MLISNMLPVALMKKYDAYSTAHLILPRVIKEDKTKTYYNYIKKSKKFKILDNMAYEESSSIDFDELFEMAHDLDVDVIVCPDVWCNFEKTIELTQAFLDKYSKVKNRVVMMGVIQGSNFKEWMKCAEIMAKDPRIGMIGIPFLTTARCFKDITGTDDKNVLPNRIVAVRLFEQMSPKKIHLLGMGNPFEIALFYKDRQVISADSSVAFHAALEGVKLDETYVRKDYGKVRHTWYETKFSESTLSILEHNLKIIKYWSEKGFPKGGDYED